MNRYIKLKILSSNIRNAYLLLTLIVICSCSTTRYLQKYRTGLSWADKHSELTLNQDGSFSLQWYKGSIFTGDWEIIDENHIQLHINRTNPLSYLESHSIYKDDLIVEVKCNHVIIEGCWLKAIH